MSAQIVRHDSEEGRTYETPNGELDSVTTKLNILNKPFLVPWAAKMAAEYFKDEIDSIVAGELDIKTMDIDDVVKQAKAHYKKKSEEAMEYGTAVHGFLTTYFSFGQLPEDQAMRKLVMAGIAKITGELRMAVGETEKMIYYKNIYAGTLDMSGVGIPIGHKHAKNIILDIKTGKGTVYEEALIQVSAYAEAQEFMTGGKVDLAVILPLNKETGEAGDLVILSRRQWKKYSRAFQVLCRYSESIKKARKKK